MPVLGQIELVDLTLPASGAKVKVNKNITHNDVAGAANLDSAMDTQKYTFTAVVKEWDMTNQDGSVAAITIENVAKLNYVDVEYVNQWVNDLLTVLRDGKKGVVSQDETLKSSPTTSQSIEVNQI